MDINSRDQPHGRDVSPSMAADEDAEDQKDSGLSLRSGDEWLHDTPPSSSQPERVNDEVRSKVITAIEEGSVEELTKLLDKPGVDGVLLEYTLEFPTVEPYPYQGLTPLLLAAALGKKEVVGYLLDAGANIQAVDSDRARYTVLHMAAKLGDCDTLGLLLDRGGIDVDVVDDDGRAPFFFACWHRHLGAAQLLASRGADIDRVDASGWNALHVTCSDGYIEIVQWLLGLDSPLDGDGRIQDRKYINPNAQTSVGDTPLILAAYWGQDACVDELLADHRVDVTMRNDHYQTALTSLASSRGYLAIVLKLLRAQVYSRLGPLGTEASLITDVAEVHGIQQALLDGFEDSVTGEDIPAVMDWAVANGSRPLINKCCEANPELIQSKENHSIWVYVAARQGDNQRIQDILDCGVDLQANGHHARTALHLAAEDGHRVAVQQILETMHHASSRPEELGYASVISFIMQGDANGDSAIALAGKRKHGEISTILWNEFNSCADIIGGDMLRRELEGSLDHIVELAAQYGTPGDERIVSLLLRYTCASPPSGADKWTSLHWAVYCSRATCAWWLLSNGAHLKREEIQIALKIIHDRNHRLRDDTSKDIDSLMERLLQNPPPVVAPAAGDDNYHRPALPEPPKKKPIDAVLECETTIVDFFLRDGTVDFQLKRRTMREVIYDRDKGPNTIMEDGTGDHFNDFENLKRQLDNVGKATKHTDPSEREPGKRRTEKTAGGPREGIEALREAQRRHHHDFRWIHIPAKNIRFIEHTMTRIARDTGKTTQHLHTLLRHLRKSCTEVAAGGGKRYLEPQFYSGSVDNANRAEKVGTADDDEGLPTKPSEPDAGRDTQTPPKRETASRDRWVALYVPFLTAAKKRAVRPCVIDEPDSGRKRDSYETDHETMSLDQFYYATIEDTDKRDSDQVLSRYLRRMKKEPQQARRGSSLDGKQEDSGKGFSEDDSVFTVDQLWLWIIDGSTIITATTKDSNEFVDVILDHIVLHETRGGFKQPQSADQMMELILVVATGASFQNIQVPGLDQRKGPLEIFRGCIKWVSDEEAELSTKFVASLAQHQNKLPERDFGKEFNLLYEIKDIRDELNILKTLTACQQRVWEQAFGSKNKKANTLSIYQHAYEPVVMKAEVEDMTREARTAQDAINLLLDLKQKYTGSQDADFGRQQAYTTMVFTIVSIIFLPLSFLTSLFALNVSDFPHEGGDLKFRGWWIFPIIFGTATAIAIPSIIIALNVSRFIVDPYRKLRHLGWSGCWKGFLELLPQAQAQAESPGSRPGSKNTAVPANTEHALVRRYGQPKTTGYTLSSMWRHREEEQNHEKRAEEGRDRRSASIPTS